MGEYEDFHIVANKSESERAAKILRGAGIRILERVETEIGVEYVIQVHRDDLENANKAFWDDVGPGRSFTSTDC